MEKSISPALFVNDGSFMEKFQQLQQQKQQNTASEESKTSTTSVPRSVPHVVYPLSKKTLESKASNAVKQSGSSSSGGKLAFSLKQKTKVAVPAVKLGADEDDEENSNDHESLEGRSKRQKVGKASVSELSPRQGNVAPSSPSDPAVKNAADKLACFVAKNGRQFEDITRQKNPGDTPFKFLFDRSSSEYKYYEYRLLEAENVHKQTKDAEAFRAANTSQPFSKISGSSQKSRASQQSDYQIPAAALYETREESRPFMTSAPTSSGSGEITVTEASDPIAMMEFYMKKAAHEERKRQPKHSKDEMPPPASLLASSKKGHHMGDYIPQEELEMFLSVCNDAAGKKVSQEAAEKAKIQADNVGHKLLSKMGWKEGEGLGSSKSGRADPVMAGSIKTNNLGVGAAQPGEVTPDDDIYEQYKKRMMLGYRYRPNPLNNPRKAYY